MILWNILQKRKSIVFVDLARYMQEHCELSFKNTNFSIRQEKKFIAQENINVCMADGIFAQNNMPFVAECTKETYTCLSFSAWKSNQSKRKINLTPVEIEP